MMVDERYIAGLFDGEGSTFITVTKEKHCPTYRFRPMIKINMKNKTVLDMVKQRLGCGYVSKDSKGYTYRCETMKDIELFCKRIAPYCIVKKRMLETMLEYIQFVRQIGYRPKTEEERRKVLEFREKIHKLNHKYGKTHSSILKYSSKKILSTNFYVREERQKNQRRMFNFITKVWNPLVGCFHGCVYCWARRQARRQKHRCFYCYHFHPHMHKERLRKFPKSGIVFVVSMGDMWGDWVPRDFILQILRVLKPYWEKSDLTFFFESKNPARYAEFADYIPPNSTLSTTIETNRNYKVSSAPPPETRYRAMLHPDIEMFAKHVSIEPIMKFDLKVMYRWIQEINPKMVSIGYDNYNSNLPEPTVEEARKLIDKLRRFTLLEIKKDRRGFYSKLM